MIRDRYVLVKPIIQHKYNFFVLPHISIEIFNYLNLLFGKRQKYIVTRFYL